MKNKQLILPFVILLAIFAYFIYGAVNSDKRVSDAKYINDNKITMNVNNKSFKLSYPKELQAVHRDSLEWTAKLQSTAENGALYVIADKDKAPTLTSPYILVGYFKKEQTTESGVMQKKTIEQIQEGIDQMIKMIPGSKIINKVHEEPTIAANAAYCEELYQGERLVGTQTFKEKYIAYAFIEHDKDFWISLSFTTTTKTEYDDRIKMFYEVVRSYQN